MKAKVMAKTMTTQAINRDQGSSFSGQNISSTEHWEDDDGIERPSDELDGSADSEKPTEKPPNGEGWNLDDERSFESKGRNRINDQLQISADWLQISNIQNIVAETEPEKSIEKNIIVTNTLSQEYASVLEDNDHASLHLGDRYADAFTEGKPPIPAERIQKFARAIGAFSLVFLALMAWSTTSNVLNPLVSVVSGAIVLLLAIALLFFSYQIDV